MWSAPLVSVGKLRRAVVNAWTTGSPVPAFTTARRNFPTDTNGADHIWLSGGYATDNVTPMDSTEVFCQAGGPTPTPTITPTPTATATATVTGTPSPTPTCIPGGSPGPWTEAGPLPVDLYGS